MTGNTGRELTLLRRRIDNLETVLDSQRGQTQAGTVTILVQVFQETAIPTESGKYFACHPVAISGTESEGSMPTFTPDTTQKLYVAILGTQVPVAGDVIRARMVGGRWESTEGGVTPGATCGCLCVSVTGCDSLPLLGATVTATITASPVASLAITAAGSGYTASPTVTISGGGGSGATATVSVGGGGVSGITLVNGGLGYTSAPTVTLSGGGGTGATATATVSVGKSLACSTDVYVSSLTLTNGGSGYTSAPTVSFSGGGGSGASAIAVVSGAVTSIARTSGGAGYTSTPTVLFSGGGGSGATATAAVSGGVVTGVTLTGGGSGYTSAPTITISGFGTGATATATVTFNVVKSFVVTSGGSGYSTPPTVTISGGGGSSAAATAAIVATACLQTGGNATYGVTAVAPRYATSSATSTTTSACGVNSVTITLSPASGYVCCPGGPCGPYPTSLTWTDSNGTITLNYYSIGPGDPNLSGVGYAGSYLVTKPNVYDNGSMTCGTKTIKVWILFQCNVLGASQIYNIRTAWNSGFLDGPNCPGATCADFDTSTNPTSSLITAWQELVGGFTCALPLSVSGTAPTTIMYAACNGNSNAPTPNPGAWILTE